MKSKIKDFFNRKIRLGTVIIVAVCALLAGGIMTKVIPEIKFPEKKEVEKPTLTAEQQAERKKIMREHEIYSENGKIVKEFEKAMTYVYDRARPLECIKDLLKYYDIYRKEENPKTEVMADYEEKLARIVKDFIDNFNGSTYASLEMDQKMLRGILDRQLEAMGMIEIMENGDSEQIIPRDFSATIWTVLEDEEKLLAAKKVAGEAAKQAGEDFATTNQNIRDEEVYYETFLTYAKKAIVDGFDTLPGSSFQMSEKYIYEATYGDNFGYYILDIDSDGVKELLMGRIKDEDMDIYDIFTVSEGKMISVGTTSYAVHSGDGIGYRLYQGKKIGKMTIGEGHEFYTYEGGELKYIETLEYDDRGDVYTYRTVEDSDGKMIDEEKLLEIVAKYKPMNFSFVSFETIR